MAVGWLRCTTYSVDLIKAPMALRRLAAMRRHVPQRTLHTLLRHAYNGLPDGFSIEPADRQKIQSVDGGLVDASFDAATYGEVTPKGVATLIHALHLDDTSVFYDLGSGRGVAVLQVALQSDVRVQRAVGVELSTSRHEIAVQALEGLAARVPSVRERVQFICADLGKSNFYQDATEVFCTNLLFGHTLNRSLSTQLARSESLRRVATLKPLEQPDAARLRLLCILKLPFTWASQCRVYVYERRRRAARR